MKNIFSLLFGLFLLFVVAGCGYKPTANIAKQTMGEKIFIDVKIDILNLTNSILIKDSLINMISSKLNAKIVHERSFADTIIYGELQNVSEVAMDSDLSGYTKIYRENVTVFISYTGKDKQTRSFTVSNYYDFIISTDSVITQSKREEAIKLAINKALADVFSKIAIQTYKVNNIDQNVSK